MLIVPDSAGFREGNDKHEPKGTPDRDGDGRGDGGQFARRDESPAYGGVDTRAWTATTGADQPTFDAIFRSAGYRVNDATRLTLGDGKSPGLRLRGVTMTKARNAIARHPQVGPWRFTFESGEYIASKAGGMAASKAGVKVNSADRARYKGAKIRMARE
jgi:hypothetical protein